MKEYTISSRTKKKKVQPLRQLAQLSIWRGGLGVLDIDTQLNCQKIK